MDGRDDTGNNSGATDFSAPQGIFTPNPTAPPAQNPPVITGSVVEPATTGLSHPYVSNHPTQTFSSETGDIVIKRNPIRKIVGVKFFILIGIALVLMVIVGVVIANVMRSQASKEFETKFRAYASYLLYEDSTDDSWTTMDQSDNYMTMSDYALYRHFYEPDHTDYFNSLTVLFDDCVSKYDSVSKNMGTGDTFFDQYIENYRTLMMLAESPRVNHTYIQTLLLESGKEGVLKWLEDNFSNLRHTELGRDYYNIVKEYSSLVVSGSESTAWEKENSLYNKLILIQSYLIDSLQQDCWSIWEIIVEQSNE